MLQSKSPDGNGVLMQLTFRCYVLLALMLTQLAEGADAAALSAPTVKTLKETRTMILGEISKSNAVDFLLKENSGNKSAFSGIKQQMLDAVSGPSAHNSAKARWGESLSNTVLPVTPITLKNAAKEALAWNLDGQMARLLPALREADEMEAKSVFDWEAFTSTSYDRVNQSEPASGYLGIPQSGDAIRQTSIEGRMGLRKRVATGASIEVSTGLMHQDDTSVGREYIPNPAYIPDATIALIQPLLRNAGPTVNRFRVVFAENTKERDRLKTEQILSQVVLETEKAYWELGSAHYRLMIAQELLARTEVTCMSIEARRGIDVKPVQMAQAQSFLLSRTDEWMRAQAEVRNTCDRLKEIINSTSLGLLDESVLLPEDRPQVIIESLSLQSAVATALQKNAELRQALLDLENSQKECEVYRIQMRPQLDLKLEGRINGIGDKFDNSYTDMDNHLGGKVMLELTVPIGNQAARSALNRAELNRKDREINFRKVARSVTRSIKESLRKVQLTFSLTGVTREARLAAAEDLRILQEREKDAEPLTPEFLLDLKLSTQQRLAEAELREYRALIDYRIAFAEYLHENGTLLERYGFSTVRDEEGNGGGR